MIYCRKEMDTIMTALIKWKKSLHMLKWLIKYCWQYWWELIAKEQVVDERNLKKIQIVLKWLVQYMFATNIKKFIVDNKLFTPQTLCDYLNQATWTKNDQSKHKLTTDGNLHHKQTNNIEASRQSLLNLYIIDSLVMYTLYRSCP